jgi:hypothetical protein
MSRMVFSSAPVCACNPRTAKIAASIRMDFRGLPPTLD